MQKLKEQNRFTPEFRAATALAEMYRGSLSYQILPSTG